MKNMTDETNGKIVITLESEEREYQFVDVGVDFDSAPEEILDAIQAPVLEDTGINIKEGDEHIYVVKKMENTKNVKVFPKSPAGK